MRKELVMLAIQGFKSRLVSMQEYEEAAIVRTLERDLSDDIYDPLLALYKLEGLYDSFYKCVTPKNKEL